MKKRNHLTSLSKSIRHPAPTAKQEEQRLTFLQRLSQHKVIKFLKAAFDFGKKGIDIIDDAWTTIGNLALPKSIVDSVSPILVSVVGGFVHATEAIKSLVTFINSLRKPNTVYSKGKAAAHLTPP